MNTSSHPRSDTTDVLLVEHDPLIREHMELLLETAGHGCLSVASIAEARAALATMFFPMVIVDRILNDGDGIDLCQEVRRRSRNGRSYLMLFSALDSEDDLARGLAAGADDYLSKRASDDELMERLTAASHMIRLPHTRMYSHLSPTRIRVGSEEVIGFD